nr:MAG TPA: hypothetical protein [Caudoviricetes sp.]
MIAKRRGSAWKLTNVTQSQARHPSGAGPFSYLLTMGARWSHVRRCSMRLLGTTRR